MQPPPGYSTFTKKQAKSELAAIRDPNYRDWAGHPYGPVPSAFLAYLRHQAGETTKSAGKGRARAHCSKCRGPHKPRSH